MRILRRLIAKLLQPPKPKVPKYQIEVADGLFVESIFPDMGPFMPAPRRGRFAVSAEPEATPDKPTAS